jgi:exonuclease III
MSGPPTRICVVTWNVQHAGPGRSHRQVDWLATCPDPDVVVLTEVSSGPGSVALTQALTGHGYTVLTPDITRPGTYGTLLATRCEIQKQLHPGIPVLPHRSVAAIIHAAGHPLTVVGLYVPSRGPRQRRNVDKRSFQQAAAAALPALGHTTSPVLITGDLNVLEPGHQPHYRLFGTWEYDFYRAFAAAGFLDAYRAVQPDGADHSWYGRAGNGYRFDHTFLSTPHRPELEACAYDHEPRLAGLSDHSAMITTLHLHSSTPDPTTPAPAVQQRDGAPA